MREDTSENKLASPPSDLSDVENFLLDNSISIICGWSHVWEKLGLSIESYVSPRLRTDKTRNGGWCLNGPLAAQDPTFRICLV